LALTAFPVTFQRDVEKWLDRLAGKAGLEEGPLRPLRDATLVKWRFAIRQMASALVHAGRDPASIEGLADLVSVDAAQAIPTFFLARAGGVPCAQTGSIAADLKAIAKHHAAAPDAVLAKLRRMAGRVTPPHQGMTAKNRAMLRQFASEAQQRRLLTLPQRLFDQLLVKKPLKIRDALHLQSAIATAILLAVPMRLKNLCRLEPGRHLRIVGRGRNERWYVLIPGEEVKNGEAIELPLPERTVALLRLYRERVLPVLAPGSTYLFPGSAGPKAEVTLGTQLPRFLERELGCRLSAHQFRHLVGFIYLQHHPNGHEVVRRMLGHRDIRTTIAFYVGMETVAAAGHYEAVIDQLLAPQPRADARRGRRPPRHRGIGTGVEAPP
jgi:integrase